MRNSRKILFILFLILVFSIVADFVLARELEVTYPAVGNIPGPSSTRTLLPDYVKYIFNLIVALSGLVVFGVIIYAGFLYVTSAGNPTVMSDAKDRIISAIIGAIIILASYLLLTTINPQLVVINPILGTNEGVIVYDTEPNCRLGMSNPESQNNLKPDENYIKFGVSSRTLEKLNGKVGAIWLYKPTTELKVNLYPDENWGGLAVPVEPVQGQANPCVDSPLLAAKSIELAWQNPGVYLCKDAAGKDCSVYSGSQPRLANGFEDKVVLIKFKNPYAYDSSLSPTQCSEKQGTYFPGQETCGYFTQKYGAVLHEGQNYTETCKEFFSGGDTTTFPITPGSDNIFPGYDGVSSITVFLQPQPGETPEGKGVTLYENIDYNKDPGGEKTLTAGNYPDFTQLQYTYSANYTGSKNPNISNSVSSIKIDGNYMTLLFKDGQPNDPPYTNRCEVFRDNDPNLDTKTGNSIGDNKPSSTKVIIIKK